MGIRNYVALVHASIALMFIKTHARIAIMELIFLTELVRKIVLMDIRKMIRKIHVKLYVILLAIKIIVTEQTQINAQHGQLFLINFGYF